MATVLVYHGQATLRLTTRRAHGGEDPAPNLVESASRLPGRSLRSMGAIHLATALVLRDALDVVVTYDKRLATVAEAHHLSVDSPGIAANG